MGKFNYRFIEESGYGKKAETLADMRRATDEILSGSFAYGRDLQGLRLSGAVALAQRITKHLSPNRLQAPDQIQSL